MNEDGLSAISAFYANPLISLSLSITLENRGYSLVDSVTTADNLMRKHAEKLRGYDLYAMDVDLGHPESYDFTAAHALYEFISPGVTSGRVKFYPASDDPRIVAAAKKEGLPAITKRELEDLIFAMPLVKKLNLHNQS